MRLGRKARTGLCFSLGVLAGIAIILLPGLLTVTSSPLLNSHNGNNNGHPSTNNSTTTTTPTSNSTNTTTASPGTQFANLTSSNSSSQGSNPTKISSGSPPTMSAITATALMLLVSTIIIPALALSFLARSWSIRKVHKNLEEDTSLLETS